MNKFYYFWRRFKILSVSFSASGHRPLYVRGRFDVFLDVKDPSPELVFHGADIQIVVLVDQHDHFGQLFDFDFGADHRIVVQYFGREIVHLDGVHVLGHVARVALRGQRRIDRLGQREYDGHDVELHGSVGPFRCLLDDGQRVIHLVVVPDELVQRMANGRQLVHVLGQRQLQPGHAHFDGLEPGCRACGQHGGQVRVHPHVLLKLARRRGAQHFHAERQLAARSARVRGQRPDHKVRVHVRRVLGPARRLRHGPHVPVRQAVRGNPHPVAEHVPPVAVVRQHGAHHVGRSQPRLDCGHRRTARHGRGQRAQTLQQKTHRTGYSLVLRDKTPKLTTEHTSCRRSCFSAESQHIAQNKYSSRTWFNKQ